MSPAMMAPDGLAQRLLELELRLLQAEPRRSAAQLQALLAEDFIEIGASGRRYDKAQTIAAVLVLPLPQAVRIEDFQLRLLSAELALVDYRLCRVEGARLVLSRRSSIWRQEAQGWRLLHHQGTRQYDQTAAQ